MAVENQDVLKTVALLAAGVVLVPLFRRVGLGSVLGYLAAGVVIGPFGLKLFLDPQTILHVAELGVVMFLFIIGLEMQPSRLWNLRKQIFGLGLAQVTIAGATLTLAGIVIWGLKPAVALIAGMGFVLSSTAIVMQVLEERGDRVIANRQRVMSVLLLEDLAIVPLLALIAFLSPGPAETGATRWLSVAAGLAGVVGLVAVSRWLLNPMFRILAASGAREIMTAAALLVVLGAALAMQWSGLSMAMGAFAAGVMLSESSFRHQLEADIEPFRGLLLGLFFMGVGMSLDVNLVLHGWRALLIGVLVFVALKMLVVYGVGRLSGETNREAAARAALMSQGGEFAFVLYSAATQGGILSSGLNAALTAAVIMSMALTPLIVLAARGLLQRRVAPVNMDGVEEADGLDGDVLMIGFGRFGQIASQALMAQNISVSIIETDTDLIRSAAKFGFKVYYGDGARLDVLHASGADKASAILVCVDRAETTTRIVEMVKEAFPLVPVLARAYDRQHAIELQRHGVDHQTRETFESALKFGGQALRQMGVAEDEAAETCARIRKLDAERMAIELADGFSHETTRKFLRDRWSPAPLQKPQREGKAINPEAKDALAGDKPKPTGDFAI